MINPANLPLSATPNASPLRKPHRFVVLDAWRGVAAILVVIFHFSGNIGADNDLQSIPFIANCWLMVDFFFVLSGFVISYAALGKLIDKNSASAFLIRRFGRIWPLHAAILAAFVSISLIRAMITHTAVFGPNNSLASVFYNLLMIHAMGLQSWDMWNSPAWSISVEFYTYIVFLAVCLLAVRKKVPTYLSAIALILFSLAILVWHGSLAVTFDFGFFRCIFSFFIGHLTYLLWRYRKNHWRLLEWLAVGLAIVAVAISTNILVQFCTPIVFAFLIWVFAEEPGAISRLGQSPLFQRLGAWSYSIYMTHWLLIYLLGRILPRIDGLLGTHFIGKIEGTGGNFTAVILMPTIWIKASLTALMVVSVVLLSWSTYNVIEQPFRRYFNRLAGKLLRPQ